MEQRSAEARAEASGRTVDEVVQSWAGGESVASVEKPAEEAPPIQEEPTTEETVPVEEPPTVMDQDKENAISVQEDDDEEIVQLEIEEENV